jgi:tetratricopeptide (TPR) repeat protein
MRRSVIAWLLASVATISVARAAPPDAAPPDAAPANEDEIKAAARNEVRAGSEAFQAGDYPTAIIHYEAAIALRPAPKLHYNIAVCHQRLSLSAETPEERTRQRDLAIERYNAYLEQNPQAEDRLDVAQTIRDLGGSPVTMPGLKPIFEGEPEPGDGDVDEGTHETPADPPSDPLIDAFTEPPPQEPPPYPNHGRFGMVFLGGFSPSLSKAQAVDARGLFAVDVHGGGFVGKRHRFLLAGHGALLSGATLNPDGLSFYGYSLGLLGQQTWALGGVVGREAVQIGFGGLAALTGQGINERVDVPPPLCSLTDRGAQIANRTGGLFASRFDLGILMGARRRGMIGILVQPSLGVFGDGRTASACQGDDTPWTVLGIPRRLQFQLWLGAGFSFRF